jgi:hypothetical protein
MLVRVSRVRAGGELLAHTTVLRVGGRRFRGLKPLLGVNTVAGVTGSGKTLLAEALWLGVAHVLSALLGGQFHNALVGVAGAYGIRTIDAKVEFCLSDVEVPELKREVCIEVEVAEGVESGTAVPKDAVDNDELRRSLAYALLHVVSVPDGVKWRVAHALRELHNMNLLAATPRELCLAMVALVPPVSAGRYTPCYMHMLGLSERRMLEFEGREAGGKLHFYASASHGEASYALFEAAYEVVRKLSKLAKEERGVSAVPIIYIDDAFEGLDGAKMQSLLSRDYDASIYAATHRLEAGAHATRSLLMTYGTKASELVDQGRDFRFALVDAELVEEYEDIFDDVYSKLLGEDAV